jgi:hypothetical protein
MKKHEENKETYYITSLNISSGASDEALNMCCSCAKKWLKIIVHETCMYALDISPDATTNKAPDRSTSCTWFTTHRICLVIYQTLQMPPSPITCTKHDRCSSGDHIGYPSSTVGSGYFH